MAERGAGEAPAARPGWRERGPARAFARIATFRRLELVSFGHSLVYTGLLVCAFALGGPQPWTFALGLAHGLLWIGMTLVCLVAVPLRIVPQRLAFAVVVLGGIGPFFGSLEFLREARRRRREAGGLDDAR